MKPLDHTKPLQTCRGEKAELEYDDLSGDFPLVEIVYPGAEASLDELMNIPEKRTIWLNIYETWQSRHPSRRLADYYANPDRLACVEVTYTEGEGL